MATLGERLAEARRKKGITQTELAVALGDRYTQSMISQVENGHSSLLIDGLVNAAKELNVATDYLLGLVDDPAPSAHIAHELSEIVWIRGDRDLMGRDGDVEFLEVAIPFSTRSLAEHKLDPAMAKTFRVRRSSIARLIPDGAYIVVDYSKREPNERDIFLAGNGHALELGRFLMSHGAINFWNYSEGYRGLRVTQGRRLRIIGLVCWSSAFLSGGEVFANLPDV